MNSVFCCFSWEKSTKCSQNPGLVDECSATPRGQRNWTGPTANGSEKSVMSVIFPPAILGRKWLRQFYGRPGIFWFLLLELETFLAGALYREFREFMRILTTFLGKNPQKSIIISANGRNTRIMMDFCGFFQGKSSEFA